MQVSKSRSNFSRRGSVLERKGSPDRDVGEITKALRLVLESNLPSKTLQERIVSMVTRLNSELKYKGLPIKVEESPSANAVEAVLMVVRSSKRSTGGFTGWLCCCCFS